MKKIAIFQNDLGVGGIQKSLINLLNKISSDYEIDLFLFSKENFYNVQLPDNVHVYYKERFPFCAKFIPFKILKKIVKVSIPDSYDVAIDYNSYQPETAIYSLNSCAKKKIIWCHNDIEIKLNNEFKYRILWFFMKDKFNMFDNICAVSTGVKESLRSITDIKDEKIVVMPNIIDVDEIIDKSKEEISFSVDENNYNLISMGRITHQKGFDILLKTFKTVIQNRSNIHLYIVGDGPSFKKINELCEELKLSNYVTFLGYKTNPFPYLNKMDGFILTSRYEGQGIVLLEAKCLGLDIFIPKHLEKYIEGIKGYKDLVKELIKVNKKQKTFDDLENYNEEIIKNFDLICGKD